MYKYKAELIRVVDGDTVILKVDLGFRMTTDQSFRLSGINAPEIRGPEKLKGKRAKEFLQALLKDKEIFIESKKTGKFGRWLTDIFIYNPGNDLLTNVNQFMVDQGHAVYKDY